ncbi:MAG: DUF4838 domain-containing protein [Clostridia bacterium]|nr:DUF4838 domain-containing protein [Clostridia bacterium]
MRIGIVKDTETLRYAAEELAKYLKMMDREIDSTIEVSAKCGDGIVLGLLSDFGLPCDDVDDDMIDDVIDADIDSLSGYFAGSNERSVLMGIYNYFKSAGCYWVRPGEEGEYVPQKSMKKHAFRMRKKADYPFRGECIEGAVSFEHVRDTILWLPKVNMNLFMIEQIVPYNYMSRWYKHAVNTLLDDRDEPPYEKYCEYALEWEKLTKKCGLQLHVMGHGALNEPFGVRHMISGQHYDIPEETKKVFALVGGKRELFHSSPFFTQMCMSQDWIREHIVNWLADYLEEKPYIDFLHFWLADYNNNHCECEDCVMKTPSDWYVVMLNELDAVLTARGNNAKIVFIMYVDTLWPPIVERLNNPRRFILTTAATTRVAGDTYSERRSDEPLPAWTRNQYCSPKGGFAQVLSFTDAWKCTFDGPKFLFEYFLYTKHFEDPGYMEFSRDVARDMKNLYRTGFDGVMSDQTQRSYFPTGLPAAMVGEFEFDRTIETEPFIDAYMQASFGADWRAAKAYLDDVTNAFSPRALAQNTDVTAQDTGAVDVNSKKAGIIGNEAIGKRIATVPALVDAFVPTVEKNRNAADKCHRESWKILTYHGEYCKRLSAIYVSLSKNDIDGAKALFDGMIDYLSVIEPEIHPYFDLVLFAQRTRQIIEEK